MTLADRIIATHRAHPEWTPPEIAADLETSAPYVRAVFYRKGVKLPTRHTPASQRDRIERMRTQIARAKERLEQLERAAGRIAAKRKSKVDA